MKFVIGCSYRAAGSSSEEALDRLPTSATCMNLLKLPPYRRFVSRSFAELNKVLMPKPNIGENNIYQKKKNIGKNNKRKQISNRQAWVA